MAKRIRIIVVATLVVGLLLSLGAVHAQSLPVIPGAAGYGMDTPAGRGGAVYRVTNLNPSGPGSLKACIDRVGPRVCIFDVSGTIELTSDIVIRNPFITIAGQTAPSPGITIKGAALWVLTSHVLIQHLHLRTGDNPVGPDPDNRDSLMISGNGVTGVVIANNSMSWAVDETAGTWDEVRGVTFWKNIVSEALDDSIHPKGRHSMGLLFGPFAATKVTLYGNLMAHNVDRNPLSRAAELVMVNNVIYNWRGRGTALEGEYGVVSNNSIVGNYYKAGPNSGGSAIILLGSGQSLDMTPGSKVYVYDNFAPGYDSSDPWAVVSIGSGLGPEYLSSTPPVWNDGLRLLPHEEAYDMVLNSAGARPNDRDPIDMRVVNDVRHGTGRIINSQDEVGGWPQSVENRRVLALPEDPSGDDDGDGYTNLEEWLHMLDCEVGGNCPPLEDATLVDAAAASSALPPEVQLPIAEPKVASDAFVSVYTEEAPTLDGESEALWDRAVAHEIPSPAPSLGGTVRSVWTDDALYVFVEVHGPGVNLSDGLIDTPWRADSIELSIATPSHFKLFTFVIDGEQISRVERGAGPNSSEMVDGYMKQVDDGWVAEIKIAARSGGALSSFELKDGQSNYTIGVRANVMVYGQRVFFDLPAGMHPNELPTFTQLELRR